MKKTQFIDFPKKLALVIFTLSHTVSVYATSTLNQSCQEKYLASVKNIKTLEGNLTYPKIEVEFEIQKTLKGEEIQSKTIQVVRDGPDKFSVGTTYLLETNDKWLCSIKTLDTKA